MEPTIDELRDAWREKAKRIDQELDILAIIQNSNDLPTGKVRVWRKDIRQEAIVNGIVRTPGLEVFLRHKRGDVLQIVDTDVENSSYIWNDALPTASLPSIIGEATNTVWASKNLKPGLVRPWYEGGLGLFLYVEPFTYLDRVVGGVVDVSTSVPSGSGERRLAVVYYDISDNSLGVVDGVASTLLAAAFSEEDAVSISLGSDDRIRLRAVLLENGQTTVDQATTFIDCRDWLTLATVSTTDPNAIHTNAAAEISALTEKSVLDNDDWLVLEDSTAGNAKKKVKISNLPGSGGFPSGTEQRETFYEASLGSPGRFDLSSISGGYTHLQIKGRWRSTVSALGDTPYLFFNNDTTLTNYRASLIYYANATATATAPNNPALGVCTGASSPAGAFGEFTIDILGYAGGGIKTAGFRFWHYRDTGVALNGSGTIIWNNTAAINQITIQPNGYNTDNFDTDSYIQIVGIKTAL